MERVKVTFYLGVTDPQDSTGLTSPEFDDLHDKLAFLGGDDIEIKKVDE